MESLTRPASERNVAEFLSGTQASAIVFPSATIEKRP